MNKIVKNGSHVLVRKQDYAEDGDIIVAIVNGDNEATLKRYKITDDPQFITLMPESTCSEFSARIIDLKKNNFIVIGKVIAKFEKL